MTAYSFASVTRTKANTGRPNAKSDHIVLVKVSDLDTYTRDEKGVKLSAFAVKTGAKAVAIFQVTSTAKIYDEPQGDANLNGGYIHHVELEHPGTELEISEFRENMTNEPLVAVQVYCDSAKLCKVAGTPGNPLFLKSNSQDDKDANKSVLKLDQMSQGPVLGLMDRTLLPALDVTTLINDYSQAGGV
jgi:hypothetical protein